MIATSTVSGRSPIRPTGGAHVAHCISNSSGRQIERVSRNERPLWVDSGGSIAVPRTVGIGAVSTLIRRTTAPEDLVKSGQRESGAGTRQDCQADTRIFNERPPRVD